MEVFKEMFFKLLLFSVFSLIYYIFMINSFFNDGILGFICFGITYVLVEIIYKVLPLGLGGFSYQYTGRSLTELD